MDYSEYLGTNERMPVESSVGCVLKKLYSKTEEFSTKELRAKHGNDFIHLEDKEKELEHDDLSDTSNPK